MIEDRNVIVLQDARALRDSLVQELASHDFAVRSCGSLQGFQQLQAMHPAPLVVLVGDAENLARNAAHIRKNAPGVAIVALGLGSETAWRRSVMGAGADACHVVSIDAPELVAVLWSWGRQAMSAMQSHAAGIAGAGDATPTCGWPWRVRRAPAWRLSANGRVLACPQGRTLPLTGSESGFLTRMAASEGQLLRRENPGPDNPAGPARPGNAQDPRSVDVLVSRLRRKARHAGIELPLLAVRGCGYLFVESLDTHTAAVLSCRSTPSQRCPP
jgi:DNA-binding response OmpR family regulator